MAEKTLKERLYKSIDNQKIIEKLEGFATELIELAYTKESEAFGPPVIEVDTDKLSASLREFRKSNKITGKSLAKKLEVHETNIVHIEKNNRNWTRDRVLEYLAALFLVEKDREEEFDALCEMSQESETIEEEQQGEEEGIDEEFSVL